MAKKRSGKEFNERVRIPAEDCILVKKWVDSGESPYISRDEAYGDAIRNLLYKQ